MDSHRFCHRADPCPHHHDSTCEPHEATCKQHRATCACGCQACEDGRPIHRCCGEPVPAELPPGILDPPQWKPGDTPQPDPLGGAIDDDDLKRKLQGAIISILSSPDPPKLGPRKDQFLPLLVIRANGGDRGGRPISGVFWESPDIFVAPNMDAASAPAVPPTHGGLAQAGAPNTLWAHVWNLGLAPVANARVEFYWYEPTVGPDQNSARLIGATYVDLGNRFSGRAHTIVKCPETWIPAYLNGGHECLIVRVFDPLLDALGPDPWNAGDDRHVAQRNITVVNATSPAIVQIPLRLGCNTAPGRAALEISPVKAEGLGWLSVLTGRHDPGLRSASNSKDVVGLMIPTPIRGDANRLPQLDLNAAGGLVRQKIEFDRGCDELEAVLYLKVENLEPGECQVYRVKQTAEGRVVGGYTVVARRTP